MIDAAALARWRAQPLCGPADSWPGVYWGPERLEPSAWRELAAMLEPAAELEALVAALAGMRDVVDVGGGTGLLTRTLAERVGPVIVVEPCAEQRAHAPAVAGVTMVDGRAEAVPLADGAVDAAVATWVLQYTDEPWAAVDELARVARRRVVIVQAAPGNQLVAAYNLAAAVAGLPAAHHGYLLGHAAARLEARGFAVELTRVGIPLVAGEREADEVADVLVRLHFAGHPREAAMRAAVAPAVAGWLAGYGRLADDGVLLVARR